MSENSKNNFNIDLNEVETSAIRSISDIYTYKGIFENSLSSEEKNSLNKAIEKEMSKFRDPNIAAVVQTLLKVHDPSVQRTMLWQLPIKIGDSILIKDANHKVEKQGKVTLNTSGSCIPYDEPNKTVDCYTYYIDGVPYARPNEEHWIEIQGTTNKYKVHKKIYWG